MKALICVTLTFLTASAMAQDPTQSPPPEPLIAPRAPAFSHWTVTYSYAGKQTTGGDAASGTRPTGSQQKNALQQRTVIKTGPVRMELLIYPSAQGERWQHNSDVVVRDPFTNRLTVDPPSPIDSENDFSEFGWITKSNFKGIRTVGGSRNIIFEDKIDPTILSTPRYNPSAASKLDPEMLVTVTALIDYDSRLPISLKGGNLTLNYTFLPAPKEVLTIPPAFVDLLRQYEQQKKILRAPLAPT